MKSNTAKPKGEAFVWVTALGLGIGLLMIVGLLTLILANGITVFWPKAVAEITFRSEGPTRFRGAMKTAGVLVIEQERDKRDLTPEEIASENPQDRQEKQLFMGNKDVYGQAFAYFRSQDIESITYPPQIVRAERLEFGDGIFFPVKLRAQNGWEMTAEDPEFKNTFHKLVNESGARWKQINQVERFQIGEINSKIRDINVEERFLNRLETRTEEQNQKLTELRAQLAELQNLYNPLAAEARALRNQQREIMIHYQLSNGQSRSEPIGNIMHFYYPNDINIFEQIWIFLEKLLNFLTANPREANTEGGIFPSIFGTFSMTLIMSLIVMPFGVVAAIYLREYAKQGPFVRAVRIAVNNLAGVPSIVFGIFGVGFFVYFMGGTIDDLFFAKNLPEPTFGTPGILWASLTLALMTLPVVIVATEESLAAVSRGIREGSLACGASKWQTIQNLVLPASAPGIMTGLVLAMARGAGEVAPLILVGVVALAPNLPVDMSFPFVHLERKFMHLGFNIYDLGFQSPDSEAAKPMVFATTLVLILLVVVLNLAAILIRNRLRKKLAQAAF